MLIIAFILFVSKNTLVVAAKYPCIKLCRNPSELQQLVLLQSLGKCHGVKVRVRCRGIFEGFIVFLFHVEFIESIIDGLDVSRLHGGEVRLDERDVV